MIESTRQDTFVVTEELFADRGNRFVNNLIDSIFFMVFWVGVDYFFSFIYDEFGHSTLTDFYYNTTLIGDYAQTYALQFIFFFAFEVSTGKTLGKYVTKTIVVDTYGERPSNKTIAIRSLIRFIPFEAFSFLGSSLRGWHDRWSDTYVVNENELKNRKELSSELDQIGVPQELE